MNENRRDNRGKGDDGYTQNNRDDRRNKDNRDGGQK